MIMTSRHVPAAGDVLEQLHQTQRIEAISRLAGGVAHDYNNLLTVVTGNTELLLLDHGITGESRTVLEEIALAAERAAALTRQLLAFSRQQVMQPVALSLTELVRRLEQTIVRELGDGITLDIDAEPGVPEVRADPRQLELVILNLASNARKAMPEGGHLRIEVDQVAVTSEHCARLAPMAPGQYARLRVVDAGVGMDAATRARAFEPFFTTGQRGTGQGLGLATVYGIVKQSGGFIWVDSVPGCGTAITAYFPCLPRSPGGRRQEGSTPSNGGTTDTILLVDDDEMVRHTTARTLTRAGYRILLAADAEQALRLARAAGERVNLLLSDIVMPGMNGRELARTLTRERPDLPVLLMSGYGPMHEGDGADEETPFLAKPFTAEELYASVRSLLSATAAAP
jgi:nitrogen-specific signal transduction histidine kinase/ActR/RegA family two-component response regulator